mgnify:CR=1 FL=1
MTNHQCDTGEMVRFYEQEFYVLSNFSAFQVIIAGVPFMTSEHAYHWYKFTNPDTTGVAEAIRNALSAHDAFKIAQQNKLVRRADWNLVKENIMRCILRTKARQHEYVRRKLLETGDRLLVEDSWRDDVWGWGPNRDGQNLLGKLWMEIRAELRSESNGDSDGG